MGEEFSVLGRDYVGRMGEEHQFVDIDSGTKRYDAPWVSQVVRLKSRDKPHFKQTRYVVP